MSGAPGAGARAPASFREGLGWAALGLALRLFATWWAWGRVPPGADGRFYHVVAQRIAAGDGYTWLWPDGVVTFAAHYPVGYPALIGAAYAVFGATPEVAMVVNALVGGLSVLATHRVASRLGGRRVAAFAALFVAASPSLVAYTPALMTEGLVATGLVVSGWCALVVRESAGRRRFAVGALLCLVTGLTVLVRPQSVLLAPVLGWCAAGAGVSAARRFLGAALVTAMSVAVCAPWTARNCARMDRCVFVSANGGWNLLIGTFPEGQGAWVALDGPRVPDECREVFEEAAKDHCFRAAGRRRIASEPFAWLGLVPAKLRATFDFTASATAYLDDAGSPASDSAKRVLRGAEVLVRRVLVLLALYGLYRWGRAGELGGDGASAFGAPLQQVRLAAVVLGAGFLFTTNAWVGHALLLFVGATVGAIDRRPVIVLGLAALGVTFVVHAVFFGAGRYSMVLEPLLAPLAALAFAARRGVEAAAVATVHPALLTVVARPGDTARQELHPDAVD